MTQTGPEVVPTGGAKVNERAIVELRAVAELDAIPDDDPEGAHSDADDVLLGFVPEAVAAAYGRVLTRCGGFWYA